MGSTVPEMDSVTLLLYLLNKTYIKSEIKTSMNRLYPTPASFLSVLHCREYFKDWSPYPGG